jgi:hypothetical protein
MVSADGPAEEVIFGRRRAKSAAGAGASGIAPKYRDPKTGATAEWSRARTRVDQWKKPEPLPHPGVHRRDPAKPAIVPEAYRGRSASGVRRLSS